MKQLHIEALDALVRQIGGGLQAEGLKGLGPLLPKLNEIAAELQPAPVEETEEKESA